MTVYEIRKRLISLQDDVQCKRKTDQENLTIDLPIKDHENNIDTSGYIKDY